MTTLKDIIDKSQVDLEMFNKLLKDISMYSRFVGTRFTKIDKGYAELIFKYREDLARSGGIIHGGAIMGVLDEVSGIAAATVNPGDEQVTMELKINFLRPLSRDNSPYKAVGRVVRAGRTTIVVEGRIYDKEGNICAVSLGTWYILYDRGKVGLK